MTAVAVAPRSDAAWRQARSLRVQSLTARLDAATGRRDMARVDLGENFARICAEIWHAYPGPDNATAHLLVMRACEQLGRLWVAADVAFRREYDDIVRALRAQCAPVPAVVL